MVAGYRAKAKAVEEATAGQGAGVAQAVAPTRRPDTAAARTEGTILLKFIITSNFTELKSVRSSRTRGRYKGATADDNKGGSARKKGPKA